MTVSEDIIGLFIFAEITNLGDFITNPAPAVMRAGAEVLVTTVFVPDGTLAVGDLNFSPNMVIIRVRRTRIIFKIVAGQFDDGLLVFTNVDSYHFFS